MRSPFQFHKGTIRTVCFSATAYPVVNFNSIKVQLEQQKTASAIMFLQDFNSIKVQLELSREDPYIQGFANFNSIKVQLELNVCVFDGTKSLHFNSIKVQLEPTWEAVGAFLI